MNNFEHFETRSFDLNLLNEMYAVPSKELPTDRITEILSFITGQKLDNVMVSTIFSNAGLNLRERVRTTPKVTVTKVPRVTKASVVNNLLNQLGITTNALNETREDEEDRELTEQEQEHVDEFIEKQQFARAESIYSDGNGIAKEAAYNHVTA